MNSLWWRARPLLVRLPFVTAGGLIVYHEVWISPTAEPLLVLVGLWLAGAPIADLLDKLKKAAQIPGSNGPESEQRSPSPPGDRRKPR